MPVKEEIQKKIALIIPAYEPDERFTALLVEIRKDFNGHIVVVNDGSGSEYQEYFVKAKELGCEILEHYTNMGKGRALKNAFNYCLSSHPDLVGCVTADSDGQHCPGDIFRCMEELLINNDSLIMGCRDFSKEDVPTRSKLGNKFTRGIFRYLCGVKTTDTQTGLRGIPASFMVRLLNVRGERFEFESMMLLEARDKYPIKEIFIETIYESKENHKSHYNTLRDSVRIGKIFAEVFIKFLFSSISSTVLDMLLFTLLCIVFKPMLAIYYVTISAICARIVSATYNFLINYSLVFRSEADKKSSAIKYVILAIVQGSISAILITLFVQLIPFMNETVIKGIVDVSLFFVSYFIQRRFVF